MSRDSFAFYFLFMVSLMFFLSIFFLQGMKSQASIPTDHDKIMNFQCEKKKDWTTLIHVDGSKDGIELKDIYCPYIKVD